MNKINKLAKAKTALILDQPFFASLLLSMPMTEDLGIQTFATDGDSIRYNPEFLETLTIAEIVFVLAHEVMHVVFQHMTRRGHRDPMGWNIAGDYIINDVLVKDRVGTMPKVGLLDSKLVSDGDGTTEGVYRLLEQKQKQKQKQKPKPKQGKGKDQGQGKFPGIGEPGGPLDQVNDAKPSPDQNGKPSQGQGQGPLDDAGRAAKEAEIKVRVSNARRAAKQAGKMPGNLDKLVKELISPKVDWRQVLRDFFTARAKVDYSFAKPKRRFLADDLILPGMTGEQLGKIAVAIDCSGSIGPDEIQLFASEIKSIFDDAKPEEIEIIYFDSRVIERETFGPDDVLVLKELGGGGTAFSPIFKALADSSPAACVVLTDLECDDFGPCPDFPVLWATIVDNKAPFGDVTLIKENK